MSRLLTVAVLALLTRCGEQGFECGTRSDATGDVQSCGRAEEICVCATRSCAVPVARSAKTATKCPSEYVYVEFPFAREAEALDCVAETDLMEPQKYLEPGSTAMCSELDTDTGSETNSDTTETTME